MLKTRDCSSTILLTRSKVRLGLLDSFVRLNRRRLLSPVWEAYITDIWLPDRQHRLAIVQDGFAGLEVSMEVQRILSRGVRIHPFNLSDEEVNVARAREFLEILEILREGLIERGESVSDAWWPQDVAGLISALKAEQANKDVGETCKKERSAISTASQEEDAAPAFQQQQGPDATTAGQGAGREESEERA